MAATGSPLSFAISYGFLGGPLASRRLRRRMQQAGYKPSKALSEADVVIAHSAGAWEVNDLKPRLLVLVGLPLANPGWLTSLRANRAKARTYRADRHFVRGITKTSLGGLYYALRQPSRNLQIIRRAKRLQATARFPKTSILFIINHHDPWTQQPVELSKYLNNKDWVFVSLPGSHDDIWEHPDRYVEVIKHYARLLA